MIYLYYDLTNGECKQSDTPPTDIQISEKIMNEELEVFRFQEGHYERFDGTEWKIIG